MLLVCWARPPKADGPLAAESGRSEGQRQWKYGHR